MTDFEKLELMSKALGHSYDFEYWNPIKSVYDRYQLCQDLKLTIDFANDCVTSSVPYVKEHWGKEFAYKTASEAIVAVAVEVGRRK